MEDTAQERDMEVEKNTNFQTGWYFEREGQVEF